MSQKYGLHEGDAAHALGINDRKGALPPEPPPGPGGGEGGGEGTGLSDLGGRGHTMGTECVPSGVPSAVPTASAASSATMTMMAGWARVFGMHTRMARMVETKATAPAAPATSSTVSGERRRLRTPGTESESMSITQVPEGM